MQLFSQLYQPAWLALAVLPLAVLAFCFWKPSSRTVVKPANPGVKATKKNKRRPSIWLVIILSVVIGTVSPVGAAGLIAQQDDISLSTEDRDGSCHTVYAHDTSVSTGYTDEGFELNRNDIRKLAWEQFQASGEGCDSQTLVVFDANAEILVRVSSDGSVADAVQELSVSETPGTGIGEALHLGAERCLESVQGYGIPCNVVIVSDGLDETSGTGRTLDSGLELLVESEVPTFTVDIGTDQATGIFLVDGQEVTVSANNDPLPEGERSIMQRIAEETGGSAFKVSQIDELVEALQSVDTNIIPGETLTQPIPDVITSLPIRIASVVFSVLALMILLAVLRTEELL